uniref:3-beta hydroxysteroid dehydrogenase/isomerase n=1 Tax=Solanum tuberosum TaxID=4113 RepID=M1AF27_SOLTU
MGQLFNPVYIILNVMGLVLVAKLQAERYIRKSGINYTIIRPGGLKNDPPQGNIVMQPEVTLCIAYSCSVPFQQCSRSPFLHLMLHTLASLNLGYPFSRLNI